MKLFYYFLTFKWKETKKKQGIKRNNCSFWVELYLTRLKKLCFLFNFFYLFYSCALSTVYSLLLLKILFPMRWPVHSGNDNIFNYFFWKIFDKKIEIHRIILCIYFLITVQWKMWMEMRLSKASCLHEIMLWGMWSVDEIYECQIWIQFRFKWKQQQQWKLHSIKEMSITTIIRHTKALNKFLQASLRDIEQVKIKTYGSTETNIHNQIVLNSKVNEILKYESFDNDPLHLFSI